MLEIPFKVWTDKTVITKGWIPTMSLLYFKVAIQWNLKKSHVARLKSTKY